MLEYVGDLPQDLVWQAWATSNRFGNDSASALEIIGNENGYGSTCPFWVFYPPT